MPAPHRFAFRAMAAENEIQVQGVDAATAKRAADLAIAEVARIESKYSRYRPDSVVSAINAGACPYGKARSATTSWLACASRIFRFIAAAGLVLQ